MGNKRSRALSRPKDRGAPCVCDRFELSAEYHGPALTLTLLTDLPLKTRVLIEAERLFRDASGDEWSWTVLEDNIPVGEIEPGVRGIRLEVTNEELDTTGLNKYRRLKRDMGVEIAERPTRKLRIEFEAPSTEHRFGVCNRRLSGSAVTMSKSGHLVEASCSVEVPVSDSVLSKLGV